MPCLVRNEAQSKCLLLIFLSWEVLHAVAHVFLTANSLTSVSEVSTEGGQEEKGEVVTKEPVSVETKEDISKVENTPEPDVAPKTEPASSWWDYTSSYTSKLKQSAQNLQQSAQNFDYNKISTRIGKLF